MERLILNHSVNVLIHRIRYT